MQHKTLGNTGLQVAQICLGTMTFAGGEGIWKHVAGVEQAGADDLVKASVDAGVNFIDTADVYTDGQSEITLGRSLKNLGLRGRMLLSPRRRMGGRVREGMMWGLRVGISWMPSMRV